MKLSKRLSQPELSAAVDLLERGRATMTRQEWEKGETQEAWDRAVGTFFAVLEIQLECDKAQPTSDSCELVWRGRVAFRGSTKIGEVWDARRLSGQWRWALQDGMNGLADGETAAKAAVEKAVRA